MGVRVGAGVRMEVASAVGGGRSEVGGGVGVGPGEGKSAVGVEVGERFLSADGRSVFWAKSFKTVAA